MDITIKNLTYTYDAGSSFERTVLHDISLQLDGEKWISIIGRTGSGKSTLVQHLNGLLPPTAGSIQVGDIHIDANRKKHPPLFQDVGMVFQYPEHQLFEETVAKDIAFGPRNLGWSSGQILSAVQYALEQVGLEEVLLDRSPFTLSGGQKRRAAIAGILAMDPQVLILDEPTAGLDPAGKQTILERLNQWRQQKQRTVICITHQMDDVAELADDVVVLEDGRVKMQTDPLTLFTQYQHELEQSGLDIPGLIRFVEHLNTGLHPPIQIQSTKKEAILQEVAQYFMDKRDF